MRKIDTRNFHRATRTTTKEINRQIVLNLVREQQPISRADLARRMGVARGMVTPLVNELLEEGLIYEGSTGNPPRGRKPALLHVRSHDRLAVAVDVRFSQTHVMLCDFSGRMVALERFATPLTPPELVAEIAARVRRMLQDHRALGECKGIGLVVPGMVDRRTGRLVHAPTLGWRDVDLGGALAEELELEVQTERDAIACALAQMWLGPKEGSAQDSFVYLTVSDGVGAGVVVNGAVVRGHRDAAGEFGHIPLTLDGPLCSCGASGCLEAYTSTTATVARYLGRELVSRQAYAEVRATGLSVDDVVARARSGDADALAAIEDSGRYLAMGIVGIVNSLNPARIIVGGELMSAWDLISPLVREVMERRALTPGAAATPVIPELADEQTRLRGAAALVVAPLYAAPSIG
ncbi:MAG TPA: ROK family protein [Longimicrobiaceae bacterium]|nr:ROK family protein [Longimicrobiaceae bacterium]